MDWSSVDTARNNANSATQTAIDYQSKGMTLADELKKAIGERYSNSSIPTNTATARSNYLAAAPAARSQVLDLVNSGSILSPTQQNAILAAKRASALVPLTAANLMEQASQGTIEDLINAGTNAWNAKTTAAQGAAQLARNNYTDLLGEMKTRAQLEEPTTTTWEDASGNTWIINAKTGEKISNLGRTYHAPSAASQTDNWDTINRIINGGQTSGGYYVNGQGQSWDQVNTTPGKYPTETFIGADGKVYQRYTDGSVGTTIWNKTINPSSQKIVEMGNNMMKNF